MYSQKIIVISGPSGSGKTSVMKALLQLIPELGFSISATTREKRQTETEGKDYYFKTVEDFKKLIADNLLIEYEEVYENLFYGTLWSEIKRIQENQKIPILDIDVYGALSIKNLYKKNALLLLIHPGNIETLKSRLLNRKSESHEKLNMRLNKALEELSFSQDFDHIVRNDSDLNSCIETVYKNVAEFLKDHS